MIDSYRESSLDAFLADHESGLIQLFETSLLDEQDLAQGTFRGKDFNSAPWTGTTAWDRSKPYQPGGLGAPGRVHDLARRYGRSKLLAWCATHWKLVQDVDARFFGHSGKPAGEYALIAGLTPGVTIVNEKKANGSAGGDLDIHRHNDREATMRISIDPAVQSQAGTTNQDAANYARPVVEHSAGYLMKTYAYGERREYLRYGTALEHFAAGYDVAVAAGDDDLKGRCFWYAANAVYTLFGASEVSVHDGIHDFNFGHYRKHPTRGYIRAFSYGMFPHGHAEWYASKVVRGLFHIALMAIREGNYDLFRRCRWIILVMTQWTDPLGQTKLPLAPHGTVVGDSAPTPDGNKFHNSRIYGLRVTEDPSGFRVMAGDAPHGRSEFEAVGPNDKVFAPGTPDTGTIRWSGTGNYFDTVYTDPGGGEHVRDHGAGDSRLGIPPMETTNCYRMSDAAFIRWIAKTSLHAGFLKGPDDERLKAEFQMDPDDLYMVKLQTALDIGIRHEYRAHVKFSDLQNGQNWGQWHRTKRFEREGCWAYCVGDLYGKYLLKTPGTATSSAVSEMMG